jgi:hypothetical protein
MCKKETEKESAGKYLKGKKTIPDNIDFSYILCTVFNHNALR